MKKKIRSLILSRKFDFIIYIILLFMFLIIWSKYLDRKIENKYLRQENRQLKEVVEIYEKEINRVKKDNDRYWGLFYDYYINE